MKRLRTTIIILIVLTLAVFVAIIHKKDGKGEIRIGAILPLTGDFSSHGVDAQRGIALAVEKANQKSDVNDRVISVLYEDDQMQPSIGVSVFNKLVTINKVQVVVGGIGSSVALSIAPIAEKKHIVFISPTASSPNLTEAGKYIFRLWPSDTYEGNVMAGFAYKELDIKKAAILYVNNDFGQGIKDIFADKFKSFGGKILTQESYNEKATDFRTQLAKIGELNPEAIYLPGYYQEIGKILIQIREMGLNAILLATTPIENPALIEIAGDASNDLIYTRPKFNPSDPTEAYVTFSSAFEAKYGVKPGIAAAYAYDTMGVVLYAIEHVQTKETLTGSSIQEQLANIRNFNGATGVFSFDENGDVIREFSIWTIKNGEFIPYEIVDN